LLDLNARRVPSPGSVWNRSTRRRGGWHPSAIARDPTRGVGTLNCETYRGRIVWGRSKWIRSAVDSKKRRQRQLPEREWIVHEKPELRIVDEELWQAVKRRQARQSQIIGERVKKGLAKSSAIHTGRTSQHLFSNLLVCAKCGSKFTLANRRSYGCSGFINGRVCDVGIYVRRDVVETLLLAQIKNDLLGGKS
jgi:hypothetical protein